VQEQTLVVHQRPQKPGAREETASEREQEAVMTTGRELARNRAESSRSS